MHISDGVLSARYALCGMRCACRSWRWASAISTDARRRTSPTCRWRRWSARGVYPVGVPHPDCQPWVEFAPDGAGVGGGDRRATAGDGAHAVALCCTRSSRPRRPEHLGRQHLLDGHCRCPRRLCAFGHWADCRSPSLCRRVAAFVANIGTYATAASAGSICTERLLSGRRGAVGRRLSAHAGAVGRSTSSSPATCASSSNSAARYRRSDRAARPPDRLTTDPQPVA